MATTRPAGRLRTFIVECYTPGSTRDEITLAGDRLRAAASEICQAGRDVDCAGSLLVAADEVVFHIFRAHHASPVREVIDLAALAFERVVESIPIDLEWSRLASDPARSRR
jgi:hypothetical protein